MLTPRRWVPSMHPLCWPVYASVRTRGLKASQTALPDRTPSAQHREVFLICRTGHTMCQLSVTREHKQSLDAGGFCCAESNAAPCTTLRGYSGRDRGSRALPLCMPPHRPLIRNVPRLYSDARSVMTGRKRPPTWLQLARGQHTTRTEPLSDDAELYLMDPRAWLSASRKNYRTYRKSVWPCAGLCTMSRSDRSGHAGFMSAPWGMYACRKQSGVIPPAPRPGRDRHFPLAGSAKIVGISLRTGCDLKHS